MWWEVQAKSVRTGKWMCVLRYYGAKGSWRVALRAQGKEWIAETRETRVVLANKQPEH